MGKQARYRQISDEKTEYKHVRFAKLSDKGKFFYRYVANLPRRLNPEDKPWTFICDDLKEAAIAVDRKLLEYGKQPVNILKRKL